ncbi:MAG TPA: hypothetical protein VLE48_02795, partial [Terriglobales bacterium]|nr:hypothetical protein [Terriglobales bacterium]
AREVLDEHEDAEQRVSDHLTAAGEREAGAGRQLTIFTPLSDKVVERLRQAELDRLTPIEALKLLYELKKELE